MVVVTAWPNGHGERQTPMHAQITRVTHTAHELSVNILYPATLDAHYMLWLTSLTKGSEFHLYYDI